MKALVIGFGSIGNRHARVLKALGCQVSVVSRRSVEWESHYFTLEEALRSENPGYVVVATRTSEHYKALSTLALCDYKGIVLVEKPLFDQNVALPLHSFQNLFVAYNLRFHPGIQRLRELLKGQNIITFHVYAGQYLPDWRPNTDYRTGYSSNKSEGGGVLRDLSHELDYVNWLLGDWECLTSMGGTFSRLEINSDDVYSILLKTKSCPAVTITLNYLDKAARRFIIVNTDQFTIQLDLIKNIISVNGDSEQFEVPRDFTYMAQHKAVLNSDYDTLCSEGEAIQVMSMIEAVELANEKRSWVTR
ncbi:Gfo/Idh/MocA family oxidoreductase [Brevibacillus borstelensis]|uniref:Gfo/Idh/MocA family protein n=1 Tax=Brevibacillus borstelensis TaxID=45462 RepID=UPI00203D7732|nr:Gfo/Idh/MocA family oxidoreductase [Brevibacillus borstelensis]MCM3590177.1 Gfo/Idh/MocA family oxidoreductase [Brevibacillus borstelensis]